MTTTMGMVGFVVKRESIKAVRNSRPLHQLHINFTSTVHQPTVHHSTSRTCTARQFRFVNARTTAFVGVDRGVVKRVGGKHSRKRRKPNH